MVIVFQCLLSYFHRYSRLDCLPDWYLNKNCIIWRFFGRITPVSVLLPFFVLHSPLMRKNIENHKKLRDLTLITSALRSSPSCALIFGWGEQINRNGEWKQPPHRSTEWVSENERKHSETKFSFIGNQTTVTYLFFSTSITCKTHFPFKRMTTYVLTTQRNIQQVLSNTVWVLVKYCRALTSTHFRGPKLELNVSLC